jgi:predicted nucleic acid-binding protein
MSFVLDACALIALLTGETGAKEVRTILNKSYAGEVSVFMSKINLLEVYYDTYRSRGKTEADYVFDKITKLPLSIVSEISDSVLIEAGRLKVLYRISLADSIALAEAHISDSALVTSDHHEFNIVEQKENIKFHWIR